MTVEELRPVAGGTADGGAMGSLTGDAAMLSQDAQPIKCDAARAATPIFAERAAVLSTGRAVHAGGGRVLPLRPRSTKLYPGRFSSDVAGSVEELEDDLAAHGDCNLGLLVGRYGGFLALRFHGDAGLNKLAQWELTEALPPTWCHVSPDGEVTQYFSWPSGPSRAISRHVNLAAGVDLRGARTVLAIPPSVDPAGGRHTWRNAPDGLPTPLPTFIAALAEGCPTIDPGDVWEIGEAEEDELTRDQILALVGPVYQAGSANVALEAARQATQALAELVADRTISQSMASELFEASLTGPLAGNEDAIDKFLRAAFDPAIKAARQAQFDGGN